MIDVEQHGAVTAIRMARALLGRPLDWSAAYFLDGLLIDTGPACTAHELVRVLDKVNVRQIALTHSHDCLLYTSPSPRDRTRSRMPSSA